MIDNSQPNVRAGRFRVRARPLVATAAVPAAFAGPAGAATITVAGGHSLSFGSSAAGGGIRAGASLVLGGGGSGAAGPAWLLALAAAFGAGLRRVARVPFLRRASGTGGQRRNRGRRAGVAARLRTAIAVVVLVSGTAGCGGSGGGGGGGGSGGGGGGGDPATGFTASSARAGSEPRELRLDWTYAGTAAYFTIEANPDGASGYRQIDINGDDTVDGADELAPGTSTVGIPVPLHQIDPDSALVRIVAHDSGGAEIAASRDIGLMSVVTEDMIGYFKASNTQADDDFGFSVAVSGNGDTLAVGAPREGSDATGVGGDDENDSALDSGAVYVFARDSTGSWSQQAYVKASNTRSGDEFGSSVALSDDGDTLAVGAPNESSDATGVGGDDTNSGATLSGAAYVFVRDDTGSWSQQAYVKASNTEFDDRFGSSIALSPGGSTLAVGAPGEDSNATGVGGDDENEDAAGSGAAYVYDRDSAGNWSHEAYIKASNTEPRDDFGSSVALADGRTLAVGAPHEDSDASGVSTDGTGEGNNSVDSAGAVYVFNRLDPLTWHQAAYVKATTPGAYDLFGLSVALSAIGDRLAVGAIGESSDSTGIGGDDENEDAADSGAVYVYDRAGIGNWSHQAYIKASNTGAGDRFGSSVALADGGLSLAVAARSEDGQGTGVGSDGPDDGASDSGAVYTYFDVAGWRQSAYVKASNTEIDDLFGSALALSSGEGTTLAVGAPFEAGGSTGIGGDATDNSALSAGAVYLY